MATATAKAPEEKQTLIMASSIEEFAKNGYDNASTDAITARAGISKGILFHHFKSKKNLYLAVVSHCTALLIERTMDEVSRIQAADFFDRLKAIIVVKQQIALQFAQETELVQRAMLHPPKAMKDELDAFFAEHMTFYTSPGTLQDIFQTGLIASAPLRDGVTPEKVFSMVMMVLNQYAAKYMQLFRTGDYSRDALQAMLIEECDDFIDMVKFGVYRQ